MQSVLFCDRMMQFLPVSDVTHIYAFILYLFNLRKLSISVNFETYITYTIHTSSTVNVHQLMCTMAVI